MNDDTPLPPDEERERLAGEYVLGTLDARERRRVQGALATDARLAAAVRTERERAGLSLSELARRADSGELFRAHHGVYGFTEDSAGMFAFEDWAAQWLALRPESDVEQRRADPDCVISHDSAAVIRELGTLVSRGLFLTSPRRINTRSPRVHAYRRDIGACGIDWDITEGLPVATPGRIIADLARDDLDGSHQGTVIADVLEQGLLPLPEVGARLEPFAGQWSEPDGNALACRFLAAAGRAFPR